MKFRVTRYAVFSKTYVVEAENEDEALEARESGNYEFMHEKEDETLVEEVSE